MVLGTGQNQAGIRQQRNNAEYIEFAGLISARLQKI